MTNEDIDQLIEDSERAIKTKISAVPIVSWGITLTTTPLWATGSIPIFTAFWGGILGILSLAATLGSWQDLKEFGSTTALSIWDYLGTDGRLGYGTSMPVETREFGQKITDIYHQDPKGEHFPLSHAVRLIDIYHRQHQRLKQLTKRFDELKALNYQLSDRMNRLRQLGDEHESGERSLLQFQEDIDVVKAMRDKIESSCHRLEMLLISVQKTYEIRQLNHEISGISSRASSASIVPSDSAKTLADLERQIGCEIETFLQLERETDKHLQ